MDQFIWNQIIASRWHHKEVVAMHVDNVLPGRLLAQ